MGALEMIPLMAPCEIEIMRSLLEAQKPRTVLEWGSGGSTATFPAWCVGLEKWVAIEHDRYWYERVLAVKEPVVDLRFVDRAYYLAALWHGRERFDMIIVDGLMRPACLVVASELLRHGGVVVLHDAGRLEYVPAWGVYKYHELLYRGQFPIGGPGEYIANGICVFWREDDVETGAWCRDHKL